VIPLPQSTGVFALPYSDDGNWWGEDACYDALISDRPDLANDADFLDKFEALFEDDLDWDSAQLAFDELNRYLIQEYDGLDIDDYFNWQDWRAEHMDSP